MSNYFSFKDDLFKDVLWGGLISEGGWGGGMADNVPFHFQIKIWHGNLSNDN